MRTPCEVRSNGRTVTATLVDLSEGGLSVRLTEEQELEQGSPTVVILALARGEQLLVESLVWHSRRLKPARNEKAAFLVGLVVANPSEAYLSLVAQHDKLRPGRSQPAVAAPATPSVAAPVSADVAAPASTKVAGPAPAEVSTPTVGSRWRVRLQLAGSPRSRTMLVTTEKAEDAAAQALKEAGARWIVLEVTET